MRIIHFIAVFGLAITLGAQAQDTPATGADHAAHHPASTATPATDGEVRKIDKEQGKITLRHGPIVNLDMPGMTMVFKVAEPQLLNTVKEGDKVKFSADKVNGAFTVTAIEAAQ